MNELYVKLIPFKNADNKKVLNSKHNPLQRIKVSSSTPLHQISRYVHNMVFPENDETFQVQLYLSSNNNELKLPLSLNVSEFLFITNESEQGELRYSFVEAINKNIIKNKTNLPKKIVQEPLRNIQPSNIEIKNNIENNTEKNNNILPPQDSIGPMFTLGLSFFNDSFGLFPLLDSQASHNQNNNNNKPPCPEAISLRNELELLIQKK